MKSNILTPALAVIAATLPIAITPSHATALTAEEALFIDYSVTQKTQVSEYFRVVAGSVQIYQSNGYQVKWVRTDRCGRSIGFELAKNGVTKSSYFPMASRFCSSETEIPLGHYKAYVNWLSETYGVGVNY